jgi:hypothetical protein
MTGVFASATAGTDGDSRTYYGDYSDHRTRRNRTTSHSGSHSWGNNFGTRRWCNYRSLWLNLSPLGGRRILGEALSAGKAQCDQRRY